MSKRHAADLDTPRRLLMAPFRPHRNRVNLAWHFHLFFIVGLRRQGVNVRAWYRHWQEAI